MRFLFSVCHSLNRSPSLVSTTSITIAHLSPLIEQMGEKQQQGDESERRKTAFIIRKIGFQITDLYLLRQYENGKMPSKFPACWSVNWLIRELQYHGELSMFLGRCAQRTAALASSWKIFSPLNLQLNATSSRIMRRNVWCRTKPLITFAGTDYEHLLVHGYGTIINCMSLQRYN